MFSFKLKPPVLLMLAIGLFAVLAACGNGQERTKTVQLPSKQEVKIDPQDEAKLEQFARSADEMYKLTMVGSYTEARSRLLDMGTLATRIHYEGVTSVDGVHALTETLTEAQRTFNAVRPNQDEAKLHAAMVKLAADALTHKNEPMWLQYDKVLQEDVQAMEEAIHNQAAGKVQTAVAGLKRHYDMIRPAVFISREPQIAENMDSLMTFLTNQSQAKPLPTANLEQGMAHLRDALDKLFGRTDESAYVPFIDHRRPILWTVVIGSIIATILAYAAWQMFRDGRGEVPVRRKE